MKDELGGKLMTKFVVLSEYSDGSEYKKTKDTEMCVITEKRKFENVKNYLEATQLENKINYLEKKNKIGIDSIEGNHKETYKKQ